MVKKVLLGLLLGLVLSASSIGAAERGVFPAIGVGARPLAMGGAFVAIADSADAVYWNPAGLSLAPRQISGMQTSLFGLGVGYNWLAMVQPVGNWTLGLGYNGLDASQAFGDFPYKEESMLASVAGTYQSLLWGVNLKYNSFAGGSSELNSKESGFGVDVGARWQKYPFSFGLTIRDLYTKLAGTMSEDGIEKKVTTKLVPDLTVGMAYKVGNATWALDLAELASSPTPHVGVEYQVNGAISVRAGYSTGGFTGGLGFQTDKLLVDYAYNTHLAGDAQRLSFGIRF